MAKTLVALYDTLAEAERVVQDLVQHGFSRRDIHLRTQSAIGVAGRVADPAYTGERLLGSDDTDLVEELTDLGVPVDDATGYAEGVRRGGTLVVVEASNDQADRGLEIMQRRQAVDLDERVAQWREEGWTQAQSGAVPPAV